MRLTVCFVAAELAPLAKAGGLGDVAAALTTLLHRAGHRVLPFLPRYDGLDIRGVSPESVAGLDGLELRFGQESFRYTVLRGRRGAGLPDVMLVDCPRLYGRVGIYGDGDDEHLRFLLLARAALEACRRLDIAPDIVHCHDWHTALLPAYLKAARAANPWWDRTRSVLTIHNLGYQGVLPAVTAPDLGLGDGTGWRDARDLAAGHFSLLRNGIREADAVSTVSPTYAREICTPEYGMGLDDALQARRDGVIGILNGVDSHLWDPATDRFIPHHFWPGHMAGKERMRVALCQRLGLAVGGVPLVGMVTRMAWQKGIDFLFDVLPEALRAGEISLVALGSGEPHYEDFFTRLARAHPGRAAFHRGYSEELAHWIEAGCDAFLMPSRYEPCGLNQMYSLRYGTVPVVRRTGGLADSVEHADPETGSGTGIVFADADPGGVRWALEALLALYADRRAWARVVANGMAADHSWEGRFPQYLALYERALRAPR